MVILGIEAAARACSAAVFEDGRILAEERSNAGMTHSETLMPMVDRVLGMAGKKVNDIDAVALSNGPGSFTGLRIGAATAKGLALGLGKPLIPVGTLEALTFTGDMTDSIRVGIMDARRAQVYAAAYQTKRAADETSLEASNRTGTANSTSNANSTVNANSTSNANSTVIAPDAMSPAELAEKLQATEGSLIFFGDALDLYFDFFAEKLPGRCRRATAFARDLNASNVCALAYQKVNACPEAAIPSDELVIEYLRKSQAEREREAREMDIKGEANNAKGKNAEGKNAEGKNAEANNADANNAEAGAHDRTRKGRLVGDA